MKSKLFPVVVTDQFEMELEILSQNEGVSKSEIARISVHDRFVERVIKPLQLERREREQPEQ